MSSATSNIEWVVTTQTAPWRSYSGPTAQAISQMPDVIVQTDRPKQTIEGFGACFNELGWLALAALAPAQRDGILRELFAVGVGAKLYYLPNANRRERFLPQLVFLRRSARRFRSSAFHHRQRSRYAGSIHQKRTSAAAEPETVGFPLEPHQAG